MLKMLIERFSILGRGCVIVGFEIALISHEGTKEKAGTIFIGVIEVL